MTGKVEVLDSLPNFLVDFMVLAKLMNRVTFNGTCWEVRPDGNQHRGPYGFRYPRVWHPKNRGKELAHRYMLAAAAGTQPAQLPKDMVVMHLCDNPNCVFPGHLRLGTQKENIQHARSREGTLRRASKR